MSIVDVVDVVALAVSVGLAGYLLVALLHPDRF